MNPLILKKKMVLAAINLEYYFPGKIYQHLSWHRLYVPQKKVAEPQIAAE